MGDFEIEAVLYFMINKGGRVRNHELVTHFKNFLNHPNNKAQNRDKFKDFVNELATIKLDGGEKVLVLKKKYRPLSEGGGGMAAPTLSYPSAPKPAVKKNMAPERPAEEPKKNNFQPPSHSENSPRARSEPPVPESKTNNKNEAPHDERVTMDSKNMSKARSQDFADPGARRDDRNYSHHGEDAISTASSSLSLASTTSQESATSATSGFSSLDGDSSSTGSVVEVQRRYPDKQKISKHDDNISVNSNASHKSSAPSASSGTGSSLDEDANISVMDKVKKLNKIQSETDIHQPKHSVRKNSKFPGEDDDSHITLGPEEKEWMVVCSSTEYHEMNRLLSKNASLAKLRDITNYTALHWAAKSGKPEIIKLIANKPGVYIDQRSGYTALHLAAIHGHENIIELLVQTFKADANLRDYSGKKAKQYLKNSASSKAQQLLQSRRLGSSDIHLIKSMDDSFIRSASMRMSSRAKEMSSLLQVKSAVARQPILRSSWAGSMEELYEEDGDHDRVRPNHISPSSGRRKKTSRDNELMPPPMNPIHTRWNRFSERSKSSSRESLGSPRISQRNEDKVIPRSESDPSLLEGTVV